MRKLVGIDLNGWHDIAVRDTPLDGNDDYTSDYSNVYFRSVLDGGIGSIVVRFKDEDGQRKEEFIGGPQALASAIGRGEGWGEIGIRSQRKSVRALLGELLSKAEPSEKDVSKWIVAAVTALTAQADEIIVTIPDHSGIDDEDQERIIAALFRRGVKVTLLWHPVAMVLHALNQGLLTSAHKDKPILVIRHVADGFDLQTLTLRHLDSHPGNFAPERAEAGQQIVASCGLVELLAKSEMVVRDANPGFEFERHDDSRLPLRMLLDNVCPISSEILRTINGLWASVKPPSRDLLRFDYSLPQIDWGRADTILFETPLATPFRDHLCQKLATAAGKNVILLPIDAAAHGALLAGRRIESGMPHYLDRLEQVSLLILRNSINEVVQEDLVPPNSIVAANKEFVADPVQLYWPALQQTMEFYLCKGGFFKKWTTNDVLPPNYKQPVEVQLRQMPAQGRARVSITSQNWDALRSRPVTLDWSTLEPVDLTFEEIVEKLKPKPIIPTRVTANAHRAHWKGAERLPAFEPFIKNFNSRSPSDIQQLGMFLSRQKSLPSINESGERFFLQTRLLDYDGNTPDDVDLNAVVLLDAALIAIATQIISRCKSKKIFENNNLAKVATWSFGRCPDEVQDEVYNAVEAYFTSGSHPLLRPNSASRLLVHGLGRIVTNLVRLERAIDLLIQHCPKGNSIAALSSLLSRPASTPQILTVERCRQISIIAEEQLVNLEEAGSYGIKLRYTLTIVGGVLRCREIRPYDMVVTTSAEASRLYEILKRLGRSIELRHNKIHKAEERLLLIRSLLKLLEGTGGNAGILLDLELLDDDEIDDINN